MATKPVKVKLGKQKIEIAYLPNPTMRKQAFRKRNTGLFKKAYELSVLCGAQVMLKVDQNEKRGKSESYHYCSWKPEESKLPKFESSPRKKNGADSNSSPQSSPPLPQEQEEQQQEQQLLDEDEVEELLPDDDGLEEFQHLLSDA